METPRTFRLIPILDGFCKKIVTGRSSQHLDESYSRDSHCCPFNRKDSEATVKSAKRPITPSTTLELHPLDRTAAFSLGS